MPLHDVVPVFPLPNAVLFPRTALPLLIFESRYRVMVRDVGEGPGRIAVALLRPGYEEEYEGRPAFHAVGTVGRIENQRSLSDGRFTLDLIGLERVVLDEIPSAKPYRLVRTTPRPETSVDEESPEALQGKLDLQASRGFLLREISGSEAPGIVLNERMSFTAVVNSACANLPVEPLLRQELLELDDPWERHARVTGLIDEVLQTVLRLRSRAPRADAN